MHKIIVILMILSSVMILSGADFIPFDPATICPEKKDCPIGFIALSCDCCAVMGTATLEQAHVAGSYEGCCPGWEQTKSWPFCCPTGYTIARETDTECVKKPSKVTELHIK